MEKTRNFIHELGNSLFVVDASLARALNLLLKSHPELTEEITRLKKANEQMKKSIQILPDFRAHIHESSN